MNGFKDTVRRQYQRIVDLGAAQAGGIETPREGWIATMRKALGMSAPQLARRMGVTKAAIYQAERKEREGGVTLQQMEKLAGAMGGRFVYAILPDENVETMLRAQARKRAEQVTQKADIHMALENQKVPPGRTEEAIAQLTDEYLRDPPPDFWEKD